MKALARHLHTHKVLDPDAADRLLANRVAPKDAEMWRRRFIFVADDQDANGVRLRGLLTAEAGAAL